MHKLCMHNRVQKLLTVICNVMLFVRIWHTSIANPDRNALYGGIAISPTPCSRYWNEVSEILESVMGDIGIKSTLFC